jgi:hypothetical protein
METSLTVSEARPEGMLAPLVTSARQYAARAKAESTMRAYRSDWSDFTGWCDSHDLRALPAAPSTVALYLSALADRGRAVATLARRLASIAKAHQAAGFESPASMKHAAVAEVWQDIRRVRGTAQRAKAPALTEDIRTMVGATSVRCSAGGTARSSSSASPAPSGDQNW